ncbi:MAG: hypothetical protein ABWX58_08340 [Psychrobacillus psychrotolerans]
MPFYPQNPNPRSFHSSPRQIYREQRPFQPYPWPSYQGPRRVTSGQNFRPPQENYYSQRPSMWGNIDQMMTNVGKISNGFNTLRQMGAVFSSFRR